MRRRQQRVVVNEEEKLSVAGVRLRPFLQRVTKCGDAADASDSQPRPARPAHSPPVGSFHPYFLSFFSIPSVADVPISCSGRCVFRILTRLERRSRLGTQRISLNKQ